MNLYFSCSLTGGRNDESVYGAIVEHLLARGHEVPTAHLARPEVMALEKVVEPGEVYRRDIQWIRGCDAVIAEVSTPSRVSKMLTGNDSPTLTLRTYDGVGEALTVIDRFLAEGVDA
jgi:2'-deoxynucleoside 5'-phosphate N-hydrolase